jgi:flagellar protein FliO/FliZ
MTIRPALMSAGTALVGCLLLAPAAFAADGESARLGLPAAQPAKDAAGTADAASGGIVRTIVGLAVVLAVIYGLYWVLKQVRASREESGTGHGLQALATLPLGGNRSLQLVRAGHEIVLVGVGEGGVTPVRTYSEAEARALGLLPDEDDDRDDPPAAGLARRGTAAAIFTGKPTVREWLRRCIEDLRRKTVIR